MSDNPARGEEKQSESWRLVGLAGVCPRKKSATVHISLPVHMSVRLSTCHHSVFESFSMMNWTFALELR